MEEHPIIRAALSNDINAAKCALAEDAECINHQSDKMGVTALHVAAGNGNMSMVQFLCEQPGCDPYIQDYAGRLPCYMATAIGRLDISDVIGALGAKIIGPLFDDDDEPDFSPVPFKPAGPSP